MKKKISGKLIFNIAILLISLGLITYFCISKDGLIDLLKSSQKLNGLFIIGAIVMQLSNMLLDSLVTYNFVHRDFKAFSFFDAIKVSFVGSFFSAITPSSTGGQPMQVYLMSKMKIGAGQATSYMLQKFLIYQIVSTVISVLALLFGFSYFVNDINSPVVWTMFTYGVFSQIIVTTAFLVVSFSTKISSKLIHFLDVVLHKIKFIKNPDKKINSLKEQVTSFHECNKALFKKPKLVITSYLIIFVQVLCILLVPYFIYRAFEITNNSNEIATPLNVICAQSFVNLTSAMMPLPGATGAAEVGFNVFFSKFYPGNLMKSAILIWRVITYYGVIILCLPFSYLTKDKKKEEREAEAAMKEAEKEHLAEISTNDENMEENEIQLPPDTNI